MIEYDLLIKEGYIVDGTGNPWFKADIAIKNDKIESIGRKIRSCEAKRIIEARGLVVSPGFIDAHSHADTTILFFPRAENLVMQGVTSVVTGNCGMSLAPINEENLDLLKKYASFLLPREVELDWDWRSCSDFLNKIEEKGTSINIVPLVGHGTIRTLVMGFDNRKPTKNEIKKMKKLLAQSLKEGVFGLSTGLIYPPGIYSTTEELIELSKILLEYNGIYTSHIRGEGDSLVDAVSEAIEIGRESGAPIHVSHHKAGGKENYGKTATTLAMIEKARNEKIDITCDVYPYLAGSTDITALLPPWTLEGGIKKMVEKVKNPLVQKEIKGDIEEGKTKFFNIIKGTGWKNIVVCSSEKEEIEGKSLIEIAKTQNKDPYEILFDLLIEEEGNTGIIIFMMDESDVSAVISNKFSMIGSDSNAWNPSAGGMPHPRAYGTFPRVLAEYVRKKKLLSLEEAIRKMTSFPSTRFGIENRGLIKEGFFADLIIFDAKKIRDKATYVDPHQYPEGIYYVIVNGEVVVENRRHIGVLPGKVLRK